MVRRYSGWLLAFHLFLSGTLYSQGFHSVYAPTAFDVWAVGDAGTVYRSFDGGATWGSYPLGSQTLRGVFAIGTHVWIVGENGTFQYSANQGDAWTPGVINGGVTVRSVFFVNASKGWAAGNNGSIITTTNGGSSWTPQTSGTSQHLYSIAFADDQIGYAAGASATLRKTTDGGATWTHLPSGAADELYDVSVKGSVVVIVGANGFGLKSTNGGSTWTNLKLHTDSRSDATAAYVFSADSLFVVGGGGYIRKTTNGGSTYTYGLHEMHGRLTDVHFYDNLKGWAVSSRNRAVLRTTDGGANWLLPTGTTISQSWAQKLSNNSSIGNTFAIHPTQKNTIFAAFGSAVYLSTNLGETWTQIATIAGGGSTHSFLVSQRDPNVWLAAHTGGGDRVSRTTNAGATWTATIIRNFTSYGMPLEADPDDTELVLFAPDGTGPGGSNADAVLFRSTDFGATWDTLAQTPFRSPCDVMIVPDSNNIIYVGDGITGSGNGRLFRSSDGGLTWNLIYSVSGSEIPTIGMSRLNNTECYATAWGSGGVRKTANFGVSWGQIMTTSSTWGVDVSKDDPNFVMYGVYGGGTSYHSVNAGANFTSKSLTGSNYAIFLFDRETILAQQSGGIYKLNTTYTVPVSNLQSANVLNPNGAEVLQYNTIHNITWTSTNFANMRIELKTTPAGSWQTVASSTPAATGSYAWTVPNAPTTEARIRVMDASDGTPSDSSDGMFSITVPAITSSVPSLAFDTVHIGDSRTDTIRIYNTGTATLVITSVTTTGGNFVPGRTSFTIPAGSSDTLSVAFVPSSSGLLLDTLKIGNNSPVNFLKVALSGTGIHGVPTQTAPPNGSQYLSAAVTLEWNPSAGALSYRVQAGADSMFASPELDTSGVVTTSLAASLTPGMQYYWRVNAQTTGGPTSWSPVWKFSTTTSATIGYPMTDGWNMLSLPLAVPNPAKSVVFPTSTSNAFAFGPQGYLPQDTLVMGSGYWLKFDGAQSVDVSGDLVGQDTFSVTTGWNLIGAISAPTPVVAVTEIPSGVIISPFYGYGTGYTSADTLHPAKAYWVKASQAGQIVLAPTAAPPAKTARGKQAQNPAKE